MNDSQSTHRAFVLRSTHDTTVDRWVFVVKSADDPTPHTFVDLTAAFQFIALQINRSDLSQGESA